MKWSQFLKNLTRISPLKDYHREIKIFRSRMEKVFWLVILLTLVLFARLIQLQIFEHHFYTALAEHNRLELLPIEPNRGLIYDRNGILIAENKASFSLDLIPENIPDLEKTINALKKIIPLSDDNIKQFYKSLALHQKIEHIPLKMNLSPEEVANFYLNQYQFNGVTIGTRLVRHYPLSDTTSSVIGYMGRIDPKDLLTIDPLNYSASIFIGKMGIEHHYENELHGKVGYKEVEVDAFGRTVRVLKKVLPIPGTNLTLTVDTKLQQIVKDAFGKENGALVAIDPKTGEILALVSQPGFDSNLFVNGIDAKTFEELQNSEDKPMYNRAIRGIFPFGSTIKPFIALEGLDSGAITPDFTIYDPGWFRLPNVSQPFRDWVKNGHGQVNLEKAIMVSCDTYFYTLAVKLGIAKIDAILTRFGFGQKTGIDLDEEVSGAVASPEWKKLKIGKSWFPGDTVNSGIGQGFMSTTPLQLANAAVILANRGISVRPHLLLKEKVSFQPVAQLKDRNTWEIVIDAMQEVVKNPQGTARARFGTNFPYTVAGKTGGAQLYHHKEVNENEMSIAKKLRNHNLFIAFAPVDDPKIALAVVSEHSTIAPQIARKVLDYWLVDRHTVHPSN
jgi:penicillin-binding protein 2